MSTEHLARRLEKALADDERTNELGVKIHVSGDRLIAQGEVATQERRSMVLQVIHELEPGVRVSDQLTCSADEVEPPHSAESIAKHDDT